MAKDGFERPSGPLSRHGQITLVFQGGGALGAYQAGVYEALHEAGVEPDWVIGTSIGAVNAALVAGAPPGERLERLQAFWTRVRLPALAEAFAAAPWFGGPAAALRTMLEGLPGFFAPNPLALAPRAAAEAAGWYSTAPLRRTLAGLIDFDRINRGGVRLTVGAANVATAEMRYFDSRERPLSLEHVLASGALPPAFPAVRIDGALYWDGGILSNTPVEAVFDDHPRRSGIVFAVHLWRPEGDEPCSLSEIATRQKDLQYSSRAATHVARQRQIHRLRHIVAELASRLPDEARADPAVREMAAYGCGTRMHVVRLLAPRLEGETQLKDIDFSASGIRRRWEAGRDDARRVLASAPWEAEADPLEGLVLHDAGAPAREAAI